MQEEQIKLLREKFQTTDSRQKLFALMLHEVRLEKMKEQQKMVSYTEAVEVLQEEFKYAMDSVIERERNVAIQEALKMFGF